MESECEASANKKQRINLEVVKKWEDDDVFKLTLLVEQEKCLWDTSDNEYHNKQVRAYAWQNIKEDFNNKYTQRDLNAKWTKLRNKFNRCARRMKSKSGHGALESPKWKFFSSMSFVGRAEDQKNGSNNRVEMVYSESDSSNDCSTSSATPTAIQQCRLITQRPQAANSQNAATQIAEIMREAVTIMIDHSHNDFDPNTCFSNYLLSELNTLSEEDAASVRKSVILFFLQCVEEKRNKSLSIKTA